MVVFHFREADIEDPAVVDAFKEIALELENLKANVARKDDSNTFLFTQTIDTASSIEAALQLASGQHIELWSTSARLAGRIMSSLADDATATVTTPDARPYGIVFMASNAGDNLSDFIGTFSLGRLATIFAGANIDNGDNTNNDTDVKTNIWMSNNTTISVKNRSGGVLGYTFFIMSG